MDSINPFEDVVHYLLIRRMIGFNNRDEGPIVSTLVYMVTHYT